MVIPNNHEKITDDECMMKPVIIIAITFVILFFIVSENQAYAETKELRFYQIFASQEVSNNSDCDVVKNSILNNASIQILKMYDYFPITSEMECVKVTGDVEHDRDSTEPTTFGLSLEETMKRAKSWQYDLLILFLDPHLSEQYTKESASSEDGKGTHAFGHYNLRTKTILATTYLGDIEKSGSIWILSHEIAHFAMYDKFVSGGSVAVEQVDQGQMDCMKNNSFENCSLWWSQIKMDSGTLMPILSPEHVTELAELMHIAESIRRENVISESFKSNAEMAQESSWEQYQETVMSYTAKLNEVNSYNFENIDAQNLQQKARNAVNQGLATLDSINEDLFDANRLTGKKSYENAFHTYANAKLDTADLLYKLEEITSDIYSARDLEEQSTAEPELTPKIKSDFMYSLITADHDSYPAWLDNILYWYIMEDISPDEFLASLDYLLDKRIICIGVCSK